MERRGGRSRKHLTLIGFGLVVVTALAAATALGAFTHGGEGTATGSGASNVKVHGQWTIVVRTKSGRIVSRHNFHNDFITGDENGDQAFATILSGEATAGDWLVSLKGSSCDVYACILAAADQTKGQLETGFPGHIIANDLTVGAGGPDATDIVLSGSGPAPLDGSISEVGTFLEACPNGFPAGKDCWLNNPSSPPTGYHFNAITDRVLPSPISVLAGQSVQVTVTISFS